MYINLISYILNVLRLIYIFLGELREGKFKRMHQ